MRREPAPERAGAALEQHVRDLLGLGELDPRAVGGDLLERSGQALRLARELHGRGVRERFALARHRGLDHAAQEHADPADHEERDADHERDRERAVVLAAGRTRVAEAAQHEAACERQREDTE